MIDASTAILTLNLAEDPAARMIARTYANWIEPTDPERAEKIMDKIQEIEQTLRPVDENAEVGDLVEYGKHTGQIVSINWNKTFPVLALFYGAKGKRDDFSMCCDFEGRSDGVGYSKMYYKYKYKSEANDL